MKRRWFSLFLIIMLFLLGVELFSSSQSFILLLFGVLLIFLHRYISPRRPEIPLFIGGLSLVFAFLTTKMTWIILLIALIIFVSANPDLFSILKEALGKKISWKNDEYVLVRFKDDQESLAKVKSHAWFGDNRSTQDRIYEWEDVNFTKIFGHSVIDLGNTMLPKGENIILIRQGFGKVKILVPKEVTISLNASSLIGRLRVGNDELLLRNETLQWQSEKFQPTSRKIKIAVNVLLGDIQVIFL